MTGHDLEQRLFSATFGALLTTLSVTPLDVVKVRLQAQSKGQSKSTTQALISIFRNEGLLSLYRGFWPSMAMSLPGTVVYFVGYERIREALEGRVGDWMVPLLAGSSARIFAATAVSPLELIRTRMQYAGRDAGRLSPIITELAKEMKHNGLRPLARGLQATLWRDVPFSALYWMFLERLRGQFTRQGDENSLRKASISFACGALSGALAATITTPFDVAKTRQQVLLNRSGVIDKNSPSTFSHLKQILREEGWRGCFRGVVPRVGKVAPACAIMIGSYELGKIKCALLLRPLTSAMVLYADIELPRTSVQRIIKNNSDGKLVQKEAKTACTKAGTIFVSYLTAAAQELAAGSNQKTLTAAHVLQAIDAIGFGSEFGPVLNESLEAFKKQVAQAKEAKAATNSNNNSENQANPASENEIDAEDDTQMVDVDETDMEEVEA